VYRSSPLIRPPLLKWKKNLVRGVASLKADNLVVFYLGLIRGCGLWWEGLYKSGTTVNDKTYNAFFINNYKYPFSHVKNEKKFTSKKTAIIILLFS
jgi:hypothetical protein